MTDATTFNPETSNNDEENKIEEPMVGIQPKKPHIRCLNEEEVKQWAKAIHKVCERPNDKDKLGWVPHLRAAYAALMPFVDENCPTAYTDCRYRIGLSPHLLDPNKTSIEQLAFVILHETMHNTQGHRERLYERKGLNNKLTNFATDLEINGVIAEGVFGINLEHPESAANGRWDYLLGEFKLLNKDQAATLNSKKDENGHYRMGREYHSGEWLYQGGLIPSHGQFKDMPSQLTAEQYLSFLEVDTEEMSLSEFYSQQQQSNSNSNNSNGQYQQQNQTQQQGQNGQQSGQNQTQQGQSGQNQDQQQGNSGGQEQQGQGDQDQQQGQSGQNQGQGSSTSSSSAGGMTGNGYVPMHGAGSGSNANNDGTVPDGHGGEAEKTGDGNVKVTHIYKKNADGTKTEVGKDALVDDICKSFDDEIWDEVSKLGINPIGRAAEQKVREQIKHDIEVHRRSNAYGSGHLDNLLNYIERGLRPPLVDWKKALRHAISRACQEQTKGRDDYTYRRVNRRLSNSEFIFPGMTAYVPSIRFALDTSGSMSADEYYNALSEADAVLKLAKAKIEFVCWDGEASEVMKVRSVLEMKQKLTGGGGTIASSFVKQICEQKPKERPDVVVCATDGCFDWEEFAQSLAAREMKNIVPIVVIVYPFTEDNYYAKQGELVKYQEKLRKYHKRAQVLQCWSKKK